MFKKLIALLFVLTVLAACSTPAPVVVEREVPVTVEVERGPIVIRWYSEYSGVTPRHVAIEGVEGPGDWGEYIAEMYEKQNPGVDIQPQVAVYAGGGSEQLSVILMADDEDIIPHVYEGFSGRVFSYPRLFLELPDPTVPFLAPALNATTVIGKILAYPIELHGKLPLFNVTLVEGAGCKVPDVQWTTTEATELAKCLAESGKGHLMLFWTQKQSGQNHQWAWWSGGSNMFENGDYTSCTFNNDYAVEYLEWEKSLLPYLPGNPSQYDVVGWKDGFVLGEIAFGVKGWQGSVEAAYKDGKLDEPQVFKGVNYPHLPSVEGNRLQREAERAVAIFASAVEGDERLKEEAIKFATWLTGPDPNFAHDFNEQPGSREDTQNVILSPEAQEIEAQFGTFEPGFASGGFNQGRTVWSEEMYEFWTDRKTAREALDSFVERYDAILAEIW